MYKVLVNICKVRPIGGVPLDRKQDPLTAVGIGASLIGSMLGFGSQENTNAAQLQLAREQMQQQKEENQLNRDWQEKMWNAQNQYNTPSAMMERYKDAGLNPYLVGGDSGIGSAGSAGSPSMVGQGSVPNLTAPKLDLTPAAQLSLESRKVDAEVANQRSQSVRTAVDAVADAYYRLGKPAASKIADVVLGSVAGHESPETSAYMLQALQERKALELQNQAQELSNRLQGQYSETQIQNNLQEQNYRISEIVGRLNSMRITNDAVIQKMANDTLVAAAQAWHLRKVGDYYVASRQTIDAIRDSVVTQVESDSIIAGNRAKLSSFESGMMLSPENQEKSRSAYGIGLDIESDRTHRYIREIEKGLGNVFHVGIGVNKNTSTSNSSSTLHFDNNNDGRTIVTGF